MEEFENILKVFKAIPDVEDVGLKFRGKFFINVTNSVDADLCATVDILEEFGVWKTIISPTGSGNDGRQGLIFDEFVAGVEARCNYFASLAPILEQALASCADWKEKIPKSWGNQYAYDSQMLAEKIRWSIWFNRVAHWHHERKYNGNEMHLMEIAHVRSTEHGMLCDIDDVFGGYFYSQQHSPTSPMYLGGDPQYVASPSFNAFSEDEN